MRPIDADALKEIIMDMRNHCEPSPCLPHQTLLIPDRMVADKIDAMPTVDAVPVVHGEWTIGGGKLYHCSICGKTAPYDVTADVIEYWSDLNYCPNCGAKMNAKEGIDE